MRRVRISCLLLGLVVVLALGPGCGGGGGETAPTETASSRTVEGWTLFEAGDYEGAIEKFARATVLDATYAEAYSGLGWSYARLDTLSTSLTNFGAAIAGSKTGTVLVDSYAGSSPVYRDIETRPSHFDSAAVYASNALSLDRRYIFEHDSDFDWHDLHLIMAQSYFALNDYTAANARVDSLGGNVQTPSSPTFVEDLAGEIERLETIYGN
jgi:tetratricopeptide (TPR) repeat protein